MAYDKKKRYIREIALREIEKPPLSDPEKEIDWICECLGLSDSENDLAADVFRELLRGTKERDGVSSREITEKRGVSQGAVVYHLNILVRSGIAVKRGRRYFLRSSSLDETMEELEHYILRRMHRMREIARRIDEEFGGF